MSEYRLKLKDSMTQSSILSFLFTILIGVVNVPNCQGYIYSENHKPYYVHCYTHLFESFLRCLIAMANNKIVPGQ